ncbi:KEOPS complex subunit Pcc1 [Halovivax cerinus]|uniref:KEOPS complex subunit Pcc1 n=1 Tax=Halovivax cerinus TaxID=1487865 RepID=A0ABD5NK52_9EURY|nr:KEOPS complex subunit Pcc1 [Halovivax cerinus]
MTDCAHETALRFTYRSERRARIVATSVDREVGEIDDDRSRTRLDRDGETIVLTVEAADLTALRAAVNTWLRLVDVAERTLALAVTETAR